jgi:hypothetical protein
MANKQVHELDAAGAAAAGDYLPVSQSSSLKKMLLSAIATFVHLSDTYDLYLPVGDMTTDITTGTAKLTLRVQRAMTITGVRASLAAGSTSGVVTFDINKNGATILSTKLTIDANETTSATAAAAAVVSDTALAAGDVITIDIDTAGVDAAGPIVYILGRLA